jgi:hypothetical protein
MSEYARPTNTSNPIMNPVVYWRVTAFAVAAVALLGIIMNMVDNNGSGVSKSLGFGDTFLNFTWAHNILHIILAAAAFLFGFAALQGNVVKWAAIIFGVVYCALGIAGFFLWTGAGGDNLLALTPGLNLVHVVIGAWGLVAGFGAKY